MTDQPTPLPDQPPPLHEQVRALEADLVMCREQLAQETERANDAEQTVESIRGRANDDADRIGWLARERDEWREHAEKAQLPEPDHTNPAHLRWAAKVVDHYASDVWDLKYETPNWPHVWEQMLARADRLEAAQQQADADEELIEKAAQAALAEMQLHDVHIGPHTVSLEVVARDIARHIKRDAANLLRDGGESR